MVPLKQQRRVINTRRVTANLIVCFTIFILLTGCGSQAQKEPVADNLIIITLDGLRWEEMFTGADSLLVQNSKYVDDTAGLFNRFWDEEPEIRRKELLPFFWETIAQEGIILGNRELGNKVNTTNKMLFSYPGYNEILTGFADDERIDSNAKNPNPNMTVLEFINQQKEFNGKVAAFGSWDVFPYIINEERSGIPVNAGFEKAKGELSDREKFLNELQSQIPSPWGTVRLDAFTHHFAKEYTLRNQPRVVYIAYGETDDFAHDGEYDSYLESAYRTDQMIKDLWSFLQAQDTYKNKTTMIITTDHGRGHDPLDSWKGHGADVAGAENIWIAAMGPGIDDIGEMPGENQFYQNQVAKTAAYLLGLTYSNEREVGEILQEIMISE